MNRTENTFALAPVLLSLVAVGALVLGALALAPVSADAAIWCPAFPGGACEYYSDATYSTVIGACSKSCCGEVAFSGRTSAYRVCWTGWCPAGGCPQEQ